MEDWLWLTPLSHYSGSDVCCGGMHEVYHARKLHRGGYALPVVHVCFLQGGNVKTPLWFSWCSGSRGSCYNQEIVVSL